MQYVFLHMCVCIAARLEAAGQGEAGERPEGGARERDKESSCGADALLHVSKLVALLLMCSTYNHDNPVQNLETLYSKTSNPSIPKPRTPLFQNLEPLYSKTSNPSNN